MIARALMAMLGSTAERLIALTTRGLGACDRLGARARVVGRPHVENHGRIEIGDDLTLSAEPALTHLVTGEGGVLSLGNEVEIEQGVGIAAHGRVIIGDGAFIGAFAHVMDTNFHHTGNWRSVAKPRTVHIGRRVRVGSRSIILPGSSLGDDAVIAPGSVVTGHVPAGVEVSGVPARPRRISGQWQGDIATRTCCVVQRAFGLPSLPDLALRARDVPSWNVLGSLGLRLDLEDEFGVVIADDDWVRVGTVGDVAAAVTAVSSRVSG